MNNNNNNNIIITDCFGCASMSSAAYFIIDFYAVLKRIVCTKRCFEFLQDATCPLAGGGILSVSPSPDLLTSSQSHQSG